MRWRATAVGAATLLVTLALPARGQRLPGVSTGPMAALARGEWPAYAGTYASAKYSPLDQIGGSGGENVAASCRYP